MKLATGKKKQKYNPSIIFYERWTVRQALWDINVTKHIHLQKLELIKSTLLIFRITCRWMEWVITSGYWPNALHNGWMTLNAPLSWQKCVMLNWLHDYEDIFFVKWCDWVTLSGEQVLMKWLVTYFSIKVKKVTNHVCRISTQSYSIPKPTLGLISVCIYICKTYFLECLLTCNTSIGRFLLDVI